MLPPTTLPQKPLTADQRRLLQLFTALHEQDRATLLAFAEFLSGRDAGPQNAPREPQRPQPAPRPADESVVAAMRRLSEGYPMLDKAAILHEAASLMAAHTLQGRPAVEVIDELEGLFEREYRRYREGWET